MTRGNHKVILITIQKRVVFFNRVLLGSCTLISTINSVVLIFQKTVSFGIYAPLLQEFLWLSIFFFSSPQWLTIIHTLGVVEISGNIQTLFQTLEDKARWLRSKWNVSKMTFFFFLWLINLLRNRKSWKGNIMCWSKIYQLLNNQDLAILDAEVRMTTK